MNMLPEMGNTPQQAAAKIGIGLRKMQRVIRRRLIEFEDYGPRSRIITDAAIMRYKLKRTRRAIG